jgi:hypothetical protein
MGLFDPDMRKRFSSSDLALNCANTWLAHEMAESSTEGSCNPCFDTCRGPLKFYMNFMATPFPPATMAKSPIITYKNPRLSLPQYTGSLRRSEKDAFYASEYPIQIHKLLAETIDFEVPVLTQEFSLRN